MKDIIGKDVLSKILLPLNPEWSVKEVETKGEEEVSVVLEYRLDYVEANGVRYPIYDWCKERKWRYLDLWRYKTYITARLPRYKDEKGFFKTLSVPWAVEYERMTILPEKNTATKF